MVEEAEPTVNNGTVELYESVVYDQDGVRATIQPCSLPAEFDPDTEYRIPILIENTLDHQIRFNIADDALAMDDRVVRAYLVEGVEANSSKIGYIYFYGGGPALANIQYPKTFSARFVAFEGVCDARLAVFGTFYSGEPVIYPEYPVLYEENGLVIYDSALHRRGAGVYIEYRMIIENNSGQNLLFVVEDTEINGIPISARRNNSAVFDGCTFIYELTFSSDDLQEAGLNFKAITELTYTIRCLDLDSTENISYVDKYAHEEVCEIPITLTFAE